MPAIALALVPIRPVAPSRALCYIAHNSDDEGESAVKTEQEYVDSLRGRQIEVYYLGRRIDDLVDHPAFRPHVNAAALTYARRPHSPGFDDLATARSHLTGQTINRFTHIHQSPDDLIRKVKLLRAIAQHTGSCFQRCVGLDALNALYVVTYDVDAACGVPRGALWIMPEPTHRERRIV